MKIAIVIVVMNALSALRETVTTAQALRDPRLTLYVVDGASTDGTRQFLEDTRDPSIVWFSERDSGIYDAMNKGWAMVPNDHFVLYLGAGDRILTLPPSEIVGAAFGRGIKILIGHCTHGALSVTSWWSDMLYFANTIHHQALLVHKSVHPEPPFDTSFRVYGDWDFNARLFKQGVPALNVDGFRSYADPDGVSSNLDLREACRISLRYGTPFDWARTFGRNAPSTLRKLKAKLQGRLLR